MPRTLRHDRPHNYKHLMRRWRAVAKSAGLKLAKFAHAGGQDIFVVQSPKAVDAPSIYLSAGIHGDEAASVEGLICWAEKNTKSLRDWNLLFFPCLNPWGFISNCRLDADGRDLNRSFHDQTIPQIGAHMELIDTRQFDLAINLHEDYDAQGFYLYEVPGPTPYWGEHITRAVSRHLPIEKRTKIEGRAAKDGIVRRAIKPDLMPTWPEAFILHFGHCPRVFTVETPSEFHFDDRVEAQVALIARSLELCAKEWKSKKG